MCVGHAVWMNLQLGTCERVNAAVYLLQYISPADGWPCAAPLQQAMHTVRSCTLVRKKTAGQERNQGLMTAQRTHTVPTPQANGSLILLA